MDHKASSTDASPIKFKEMPSLPLRAGRHLTAWVRWHVGQVCHEDAAMVAGHPEDSLHPAKRSA